MAAVYPAAPSITPVRRLLVLTCAIVFLDTAFFAAITPLLPSYRDEFGLSKAAAGVLVAAYPAGTLVGSLPGGWYAARFGVRRAVLLGLVLLAGASVVFAFARSIVVLDAARFVQGIGGAATWAGALGWITARRRASGAARSSARRWARRSPARCSGPSSARPPTASGPRWSSPRSAPPRSACSPSRCACPG
jgi:MFS family permease